MKELSIYIHIPFCVRKCLYCDFLSFPVGDESYVNWKSDRDSSQKGMAQDRIEDYVNLLCCEIAFRAPEFKKYQVISVFFGGGTPSLLPAEELGKIMDAVRASFVVAADAEITVECNPGTVTADKLAYYITCGINRLSIGLQSSDDEELARIGRIHNYEMFLETYRLARAAGFCNINVDLMAALPGQTITSYQKTLEQVCALFPEHISAYSLILEEGTPLYVNQKDYVFPDEEEERELYYMTERVLFKAGYHRYEISNYARKGRECRHNKVYWQRGDYLGLGLGASSLIANVRWKNPEDMDAYREHELCEVQHLSREEQMEEFMFLGLRLTEGVEEADFVKAFGVSVDAVYGETIERLVGQKLLVWDGGRLFLTPRGIDVSNVVFTAFLL